MSRLMGWAVGAILVFGMYALHSYGEKLDQATAELAAVRAENIQLRQQKDMADEAMESTRKAMEAVNAENKIYKASIEEALKASPVWAGTYLPDDLAGVLRQNNYCGSPGVVPAP